MTETLCNYPDRDEHLVAYLYDDIDSADRTSFGSHLSACRHCQDDLAALRGVRTTLGAWAPPEPARTFASEESRAARWWHDVPAWAQVAAAVFVLGVSATIANLDVRYDRSGLTIRTGWSKPQAAPAVAPASPAPWRADLAEFKNQLRSEIGATQQAASAAPVSSSQTPAISEAELRRRVRVLLDESERRQTKRGENEIALRLTNLMKDDEARRQADLAKFDQRLDYIERATRGELLKQREGMNYLLKVSQTR